MDTTPCLTSTAKWGAIQLDLDPVQPTELAADYERLDYWIKQAELWRKTADDLAAALQANVPDPYPEGAAGVALAAWAALTDGDAT